MFSQIRIEYCTSVFSPNMGENGPGKFRTRTLLTKCCLNSTVANNHSKNILELLQFSCKIASYGKCFIFVVKSFQLVLAKLSIWQEDWAVGYHFMEFRHFPDISYFPKS